MESKRVTVHIMGSGDAAMLLAVGHHDPSAFSAAVSECAPADMPFFGKSHHVWGAIVDGNVALSIHKRHDDDKPFTVAYAKSAVRFPEHQE